MKSREKQPRAKRKRQEVPLTEPLEPTPPPTIPELPPRLPTPPPIFRPSGRVDRRAPKPRRFQDKLPAVPLPILPLPSQPSVVKRVILHVRDFFRSEVNHFGILREYLHRPSYDPDSSLNPEDLANYPTEPPTSAVLNPNPITPSPPPWPFLNMSTYHLMNWFHTGSSQKSEGEVTRLAKEVIGGTGFKAEDLAGFNASRENKRLDKAHAAPSNGSPFFDDDWREVSVEIEIPVPVKGSPPQKFQVPGLHHRSIVEVIKATFGAVTALHFHLTPFKRIHVNSAGKETRVYDEVYTSEAFEVAHNDLQKKPNEPGCTLEKVIAGLMFWSDSTHLTNFGTASVWPIYMYYANQSKYIRAKPSSGACHHMAYIPYLPDHLNDFISSFITAASHRPKILSLCKHELYHAVWRILLDDDFVDAYEHGIVLTCADGIIRRIYPQIFTYSADYPEKVILATVRNRGLCPCPRCRVPMEDCDKMGGVFDIRYRVERARIYLSDVVKKARDRIYRLGHGVSAQGVESLLKPFSLLPTVNAFMERLGAFGFSPYPMLVVDFLHEFELGVWKATFIHILRVLYAAVPGGQAVIKLNARFRQIPTFGVDTIRRFSNNVSERKKLAARDFEDILLDIIPAIEGLLSEPYNAQLLTLLYRLAEWHSLAKLRMHTDDTLDLLDQSTKTLGKELRSFRKSSATAWVCKELPSETAARGRKAERKKAKAAAKATTEASNVLLPSEAKTATLPLTPPTTGEDPDPLTEVPDPPPKVPAKVRTLGLLTYKFHALGDYVQSIRLFGTIDSYSTQIGELAHRFVKRLYGRTNKNNATKQIARHERRHTRLRRAREAAEDPRRRHTHIVGFSDNDPLPYTGVDMHHHMSDSKIYPNHLQTFVRNPVNDPSKIEFIPKLKAHLLGRMLEKEFEGDDSLEFSDEELNSVRILNDRIYAAKVLRINYTTYDMRRGQDSLNPRTHCDVMVHSPETEPDAHPFWYARILGVFHAKVLHTGRSAQNHSVQHMEFLWVRWFGIEQKYRSGFKAARLPKIGFVHESEHAFGFLDPSRVLRGCHLVPAFAAGHTNNLLKTVSPTAARHPDETSDWINYYVIIWVDRDMFMRYSGGGLGHQQESSRWKYADRASEANAIDIDSELEDDIDGKSDSGDSAKLHALHQTLTSLESNDDEGAETDDSDSTDSNSSNSTLDNDGDDNDSDDDDRAYFGPEDIESRYDYNSNDDDDV